MPQCVFLVDDSRRLKRWRQGFGKFYETKGRPKAEKAEKPKTEGPKEGPKDTKTTRHKLLTSGLTSGVFNFGKIGSRILGVMVF